MQKLIDELIHASKQREYYEHFGRHGDGKRDYWTKEMARLRRAIIKAWQE